MSIQPAAPGVEHLPLEGVTVAVLTSGHEVLDSRVYGREALSLQRLGARVTVVGKLTRGTPGAVDVIRVSPPRSRLHRFLAQPWRCLRAARHLKPDIVHFHDAEMLAILPVARLVWPRAKFVYDVHEDFAHLMMIRDWLPRAFRPVARKLTDVSEKLLARLAHGIVSVTPPLTAAFPHRLRVSAMNFPTAEFLGVAAAGRRAARDRRYDLVHLGTLNERRASFLAEVLREFHAARPGSRSLIVGASNEILEFLRDRLPEGCDLRGLVAHDEVPRLLGDSRVGIDVHPWPDPHLQPALAVKICEYMAAGTAVVASSMPVLAEVLSRSSPSPAGVTIIRGGEPGDYAGAVSGFLDRIAAGEDPGESSRRFAMEHMRWEPEAMNIANLYRALLRDGPCAT